jgi:hypothetical protein
LLSRNRQPFGHDLAITVDISRRTFSRIQIAPELPAPGGGYIVKDLPADTEIVSAGAQLLLSEEFRAQIQVGEDQ